MTKLELDTDAYGSRGQLSLMADFFELCCCVRRLQITHAVIADYLSDRRIRIPLHEMTSLAVSDAPPVEDDEGDADHVTTTDARRQRANEDAARVLSLLREREHYLGAAYPFKLDGTVLGRRTRTPVAYDVALTLALRHGCMKDRTAATDFEGFVARCLTTGHWRVFPLGARVRAAPGSGVARFRPVFQRLVAHLRVRSQPDLRVPSHVHDRGTDVVARWNPVDDRPGCRTVLVQVTVGKADTWARKAAEPPRGAWMKLLGDPLEPLVALAIPHHVEHEQLHELIDNGHGATVLDRLRLVAHAPKVTPADRKSVLGLRAAGVEW
jgi:hypothetical protein